MDEEPAFVDPDGGDYRLVAGSACIDAGDLGFVPEAGETDLDGLPRVADGDGDGKAVTDLGAYETPAPCPGDLDGDHTVGVVDFLDALSAWGPNPGHAADLDGDGLVGPADLEHLLSNWGPCPLPLSSARIGVLPSRVSSTPLSEENS